MDENVQTEVFLLLPRGQMKRKFDGIWLKCMSYAYCLIIHSSSEKPVSCSETA